MNMNKLGLRRSLSAFALLIALGLGRDGVSQLTVAVQLNGSEQPVLWIARDQTVNWRIDPNQSTAAQNLVFSGRSPCNESPAAELGGSCQISHSDYEYEFCSNFTLPFLKMGSFSCAGGQLWSGHLHVSPYHLIGQYYLVLKASGNIENIVQPKDEMDWLDKKGYSQSVTISSTIPSGTSICNSGTLSSGQCKISKSAVGADFTYNCSDGQCTDPTAHVRSVGSKSLREEINELLQIAEKFLDVKIMFWHMLIAALGMLGIGGYAGKRWLR